MDEHDNLILRYRSGLLLLLCPIIAWSILAAANWVALACLALLWLLSAYFFIKTWF